MAALVEGMAGVKDKEVAYTSPIVSPRWIAAGVDSVDVTARYAASHGYVSYRFVHDKTKKQIRVLATGNGDNISFHVLLPDGARVGDVLVDNKKTAFNIAAIEDSRYADFSVKMTGTKNIILNY